MSTIQPILRLSTTKRLFRAQMDTALALLWLKYRTADAAHPEHDVACDAWLLIDGHPDFQQSEIAERVMTWLGALQEQRNVEAAHCGRTLLRMAMEAVEGDE